MDHMQEQWGHIDPMLDPVFAALEHIAVRGSLLMLTPEHAHRVSVMKTMTELELVSWNPMSKRYEMTSYGR
jgi:hypothetical protein